MATECVSCGSLEPPEYVPDAFGEMCLACGHMFSTSNSTFITYEADPESGTGNWDPTAGSARIHAGDLRLRRGPLTSTVGGKARILPGQTALMDKADQRGYTAASNLPDVHAHIEGLLRRLGHDGNPYTERSKQLFDQARTIGMEKREEQARVDSTRQLPALSRMQKRLRKEARWGTESFSMGAAAVWITLKKGGKEFALEDIAKAAAQPLSKIKIQIKHLEHLFHGTEVLSILRAYDPAIFIPDYIAFLETQRKPINGRPGAAAAVIGPDGLAFLAKLDPFVGKSRVSAVSTSNANAEPGSSSPMWKKALQLALNLSALCIAEGHAQHKGEGGLRDIRRMAYAIVLCGIEGTLKLVSPQTQIIDSWAVAEQWRARRVRQREREEARLERELARERGEEQADDSDEELSDSDDDEDEDAVGGRQETVRIRYNEVIRLVLPWLAGAKWELTETADKTSNSDRRERNAARKKPKTTLAEVATYPVQRKKFVDSLAYVVKTRIQLKARMEAEQRDERDRAPPVVGPAAASSSRPVSRQASSSNGPQPIEAAPADPRRAQSISELRSLHSAALVLENGDGTPSFAEELQLDVTTAALRGKRSIKQQAKKAAQVALSKRVPKSILAPGILETLEGAAIDALLFDEDEMDRYLRSEKECQILDRVKAQDGSWDGYGPASRERAEQRSAAQAAKRKRQDTDAETEEAGEGEPEEDDVSVVGYIEEED